MGSDLNPRGQDGRQDGSENPSPHPSRECPPGHISS